jgi:hypothetical protein
MTLANPLRKVASKLMAKFGGEVTIRFVTPGAYNTSTGAIAESVADTAVRGVLEDVSVRTDTVYRRRSSNELVQAGDRRLIIAALDLGDHDYSLTEDSFALLYEDDTFIYQENGITPTTVDRVMINSISHQIIQVDTIEQDNTAITYELILRA